ncbi:MAG: formylglycine-generating enzyme family protein [Anaerolineales bacterium]
MQPPSPACLRTLPRTSPEQGALLAQLWEGHTPPPARFRAGHRLNALGDPRPGVGLRPDDVPHIEWVEVPGGEYIYQAGEQYHELPTFYIARYPVTVAQYAAFVAAGGYHDPAWWTAAGWAWRQKTRARHPMLWGAPKWHIGNHPVVGVNWYEASAFCTWLAEQLGLAPDMLRLPSEYEWEKAARGTDGRLYPWGMRHISGAANLNETYAYYHVGPFYLKRTTAVGAFVGDRSPYGAFDMAGNVREWCLTPYHHIGRVVRGGAWFSNSHQARTVYRNWFYEANADHGVGFRVMSVVYPDALCAYSLC